MTFWPFRTDPDKAAHKARVRRSTEVRKADAAWARKQEKQRRREIGHR